MFVAHTIDIFIQNWSINTSNSKVLVWNTSNTAIYTDACTPSVYMLMFTLWLYLHKWPKHLIVDPPECGHKHGVLICPLHFWWGKYFHLPQQAVLICLSYMQKLVCIYCPGLPASKLWLISALCSCLLMNSTLLLSFFLPVPALSHSSSCNTASWCCPAATRKVCFESAIL